MKVVLALWETDPDVLLAAGLRESLRAAGVTRVQVNLDDADVPGSALRLRHFEDPLEAVVSVWTDAAPSGVIESLTPYAARLAAWQVEERIPLAPPSQLAGERLDGLAQVAFLRRPADLDADAWLRHWHGPHTQVAMETQATFGYVQNRVVAALTEDTPPVDAIVEELFPPGAVHDVHAFYGSGGDRAELERRMTRLLESVATMGADRDLDVVPTSRYVWDLRAP